MTAIPQLSVVLATYNEEANLARCLTSVSGLAAEIIIVDGGSVDKTVSIAKKFHAKIISTTNPPNFHINKNKGIDAATGDWVLQLDADEVVSDQLASQIREVISSPGPNNGFWINRRNYFLDRFLTKGGQYPDPTLRLYRRGFGRLPARDVHEQAVVSGAVGQLSADLLHYRDTSFEKYLEGFNRYTTFISRQMSEVKLSFNIATVCYYLVIKPGSIFLRIYFRHLGLVDGFPGFIFALYSGFTPAVAFIKYWQHRFYPTPE